MKLKLATKELNQESETITPKEIESKLKESGSVILYFAADNAHKDLVALVEKFEDKDYSVYLKEVKYGLNEDDYIYEMHIL